MSYVSHARAATVCYVRMDLVAEGTCLANAEAIDIGLLGYPYFSSGLPVVARTPRFSHAPPGKERIGVIKTHSGEVEVQEPLYPCQNLSSSSSDSLLVSMSEGQCEQFEGVKKNQN